MSEPRSHVRLSGGFLAVAALLLTGSLSHAEVIVPGGVRVETVDFERHIMGLFSKTGCNNGSCHGSFQGKNGFRLSLFGYEPEKDYQALTRDVLGRRLDLVDPEQSLLLVKAMGRAPHDGGVRFTANTWQHQVFRDWIQQGAKWNKGSGEVRSLDVSPAPFVRCDPLKPVQITVTATFADGTRENITPFCDFRISDDAVATISPLGAITAVQPGDTGLAVSYRGQVQAVRVLVPAPIAPGFQYPKLAEVNFIDREVYAKLRLLNMVPSPQADDAEFLRRLTIDTIGQLPTPQEVRDFLADRRPNKRTEAIDRLLRHPLHSAVWATKFSDITGNNTDALPNPAQLKNKRSQMWHDWLRKRFAENRPYDEIVRGILTATSREGYTVDEWLESMLTMDEFIEKGFGTGYEERESLDLFWLRQAAVPIEQWGEKVAVAFLGVRLECAQCHKHPTDRWTQADYRSFANIFAMVGTTNVSPEARKGVATITAERKAALTGKNANQINLIREVYLLPVPTKTLMTDPETNKPLAPKAIAGPVFTHQNGHDTRIALFEWMRDPKNPFFARSFVNRMWAHYFGVGLVNPVDDFSLANPPSNAQLLDALAEQFIASGFDIRQLERQILLSHTYQATSMPNATNQYDKVNYSHAFVRPLMAEVVVDVINSALGVEENFGADVPEGHKLIEIGSTKFANGSLAYALRVFGRPARTAACDCERVSDPALSQTLFRMTDTTILRKLVDKNGRIQQLIGEKKTDDEIFEELVLATLSRLPSQRETEAFRDVQKQSKSRAALFADTMWALINTREFILNH